MNIFLSGKKFSILVLGASSMVLSACVGGTTYGTGVTQEQRLLEDLEGMISLGGSKKKEKIRIDYSARPDLVMPNQSAALPPPVEQESSTSDVDWPESPEQRLARVRGEAEEADPRSGEISVEELKRKKVGIKISRKELHAPDMDRRGHAEIDSLRDGSYKVPSMLKKDEGLLTVQKRKYLTQPPVEYITPVAGAPVGDIGISEAEKDRRAQKAARLKRQNDTGMWVDN